MCGSAWAAEAALAHAHTHARMLIWCSVMQHAHSHQLRLLTRLPVHMPQRVRAQHTCASASASARPSSATCADSASSLMRASASRPSACAHATHPHPRVSTVRAFWAQHVRLTRST